MTTACVASNLAITLNYPPEEKTIYAAPFDNTELLVNKVKGNTGIVARHLPPLLEVARKNNYILAIRHVSSLATELIDSGCETKNFYIKNKTATWGLQAGLICADYRYGQRKQYSEEDANRYHAQLQKSITDKHAVAIELVLPLSRLRELEEKEMVNLLSVGVNADRLEYSARSPDGEIIHYQASRLKDRPDSYLISCDQQPVKVLAYAKEGKNITADYDLWLAATSWENYGWKDVLPNHDITHDKYKQRLKGYSDEQRIKAGIQNAYNNQMDFYAYEDPEIGNATLRIRELIPELNQAVAPDGPKLFHHSTDSGNPFSDPESNYPITFFLPQQIGDFEQICVVNNQHELALLIASATDKGYYIPGNPKWEEEIRQVRRAQFDDRLHFFTEKIKQSALPAR